MCALLQVYTQTEGRNSTLAELQSLEETMQQQAEHKAAYAGMHLSYNDLDLAAKFDSLQTYTFVQWSQSSFGPVLHQADWVFPALQ